MDVATPDYSIVLPAYNEEALLHEALLALASGRACGGGASVEMEGVTTGLAGRMVSL